MKPLFLISQSVLVLVGFIAHGQSTFVYDQQSADEGTLLEGSAAIGGSVQSFAPTLSQVGFVRLYIFDSAFDNGGGTLFVTLRGQSPSGAGAGSKHSRCTPDFVWGVRGFRIPQSGYSDA